MPDPNDISLDPQDWAEFRIASHTALDEALDYLEGIRERPVWQQLPTEIRERLEQPIPQDPTAFSGVVDTFMRDILPYATGNQHPRFWGWVHGSATPSGAIADFLAATMNSNVGGRNHVAVFVERQIIAWFRELFGFPNDASGIVTVGTSAATLIALVVARYKTLGEAVRERGLQRIEKPLVGYASSATHSCMRKAFEVSGLGSEALRVLPVDGDQRVDPAVVARAIAQDRAAGFQPFFLVGNAGTVNTGAIDPLIELANIAQWENMWFHVDGAFGSMITLVPSLAERVRGMERADSLAFDFHKWLRVPYDAGCVLVRNGALHRATFATDTPYLTRAERGLAGASPWFADFGFDLSRGFRALKVWFTLQEHGTARLGKSIENNVRQAHLLATLVDGDPHFERLAPTLLNIVCFRYTGSQLDGTAIAPDALDAFNEELVIRLQESGRAVTSISTIDGKRAIRVCITNHRSRDEDFAILLETLRELASGSI